MSDLLLVTSMSRLHRGYDGETFRFLLLGHCLRLSCDVVDVP